MARLNDRVALVTGAGSGIGLGIATRFAQEGAKVVIAEYNADTGQQAAEALHKIGAQAHFIKTDVSKKDQVLNMVKETEARWGKVDVLINNAWSSRIGLTRVEWVDDAAMQDAFELGTMGCMWAMQAVHGGMKERGYGRIVNICSLNGVNAHIGSVHYNMAKEALRTITRTAAREWSTTGITCNVICPSAETASLHALKAANPDMFVAIEASLPMQRFGSPDDDIAPVALFLATEDSQFVTGNTIYADGGGHINGAAWAPDLPEEKPV